MKPLPISKKIEPTHWSDLEPSDREKALGWMIDGIHRATQEHITATAYRLFCGCVTKGEPFEPEKVWNHLTPRMQDHFAHSRETHDRLVEMIEAEKYLGGEPEEFIGQLELDDDDDQEGIYDESE